MVKTVPDRDSLGEKIERGSIFITSHTLRMIIENVLKILRTKFVLVLGPNDC